MRMHSISAIQSRPMSTARFSGQFTYLASITPGKSIYLEGSPAPFYRAGSSVLAPPELIPNGTKWSYPTKLNQQLNFVGSVQIGSETKPAYQIGPPNIEPTHYVKVRTAPDSVDSVNGIPGGSEVYFLFHVERSSLTQKFLPLTDAFLQVI